MYVLIMEMTATESGDIATMREARMNGVLVARVTRPQVSQHITCSVCGDRFAAHDVIGIMLDGYIFHFDRDCES